MKGVYVGRRSGCNVSTPEDVRRVKAAWCGMGVRLAVENRECERPENEWPQLARTA
jgi:hypothetical protein